MFRNTHRGNIFRGKLVGGVRDEQAGFTHRTITDDNTLDGLHSWVFKSSQLIQDLEHRRKKSQAWNGMQNFSLHTVESCFSCLEVQEKLRGERTLSIFTPCTALQIFFHQKICYFYNVVFLLLQIFLTIYFNDFLKCLPLARSHLFKAPKAKLMYPLNTENSISNVKNRYSLKQKWIWTLKCELLQ